MPPLSHAVQNLFSRVASDVAELGNDAISRMYPALLQAESELEAVLKAMVAKDPSETFTRDVVRRQLAQLKGVRLAFRKSAGAMAIALEQSHGVARGMSLNHLKKEMAAQLGSGEFASIVESQVNLFAAHAATSQASSRVPRYSKSVARYPGQVWADINKNIQVSILKGDTVFQATNRMMGSKAFAKAVAKDGVVAAPGISRKYRYWAERLVRTETQAAYNQVHVDNIHGLHTELKELGVDLMKRWDASMDRRVCLDCAALHGVIVPVGGRFPGGYDAPPAHPNCRCVLVTYVPGLDK